MKAIILAAGYATRLWPLTLNIPKPLLSIGKKSMLDLIVGKLIRARALNDIYIITNTKFVKNFKDWKKGYRGRKRVSIIDDGMRTLKDKRGSIGDIIFAIDKKKISSDVVVVAGDNIFDFSIAGFLKDGRQNSPHVTIGLFDIKTKRLASQYGIVKLDKDSKILSFDEKPKRPKSTLAAMCLYYIPKERLELIKRYKREGNPLDLAGSFIRWLSKKEGVYGYIFRGRWLDIGDKASLIKAQKICWA